MQCQPLGFAHCRVTASRSHSRRWCGSKGTQTWARRQNYYEVLQLSEDAEQEEIRAAFRSLAKQLHPDVNKSPDADRQFRLLKRAHDILLDSQLRSAHDAELNLPSARSRDPRFARFYRWRSEVLPDLEAQLDVWTAEVADIIAAAERELGAHQQLLQALLLVQQGREQLAAVAAQLQQNPTAAAALVEGAGKLLLQEDTAALLEQLQQQPPTAWHDMDQQQRQAAAKLALSSMQGQLTDAVANVKRLYEKRYQQVEVRYAYPAIVWYDMWTEVSDTWLDMAGALEAKWQPEVTAIAMALKRHEA